MAKAAGAYKWGVFVVRSMQCPKPSSRKKPPIAVEVEEGKTYYWCSCGKSAKQPFCDGSHKGSEFAPVAYKAEKTGTAYFCGCKHSAKGELCDGSHSSTLHAGRCADNRHVTSNQAASPLAKCSISADIDQPFAGIVGDEGDMLGLALGTTTLSRQ